MQAKTSVLFIHGGNMYPTHDAFMFHLKNIEIDLDRMRPNGDKWSRNLRKELGNQYDVLFPSMPTSDNAQYNEWKLWYERIIDTIGEPCILVGHSLGAMFFSKYYSENEPKFTIPALLLVAPKYLPENQPESERTSFTLTKDLGILTKRAEKVVFFHSEDDPIVPFESFGMYKKEVPEAEFVPFIDRGHFLDERFPEMLEMIRSVK